MPFAGFDPAHTCIWTNDASSLATDTLAVEDPALARALRFIRDHACKGIGVEDVVQAALTSRRDLERRMHALLGRSPNQEILRVRIERAQLLLLDAHLPLTAVALQCGFSGPKYFGEAFLRLVGLPPGEFRRQAREARRPTVNR